MLEATVGNLVVSAIWLSASVTSLVIGITETVVIV
jgi:hypothetical protein